MRVYRLTRVAFFLWPLVALASQGQLVEKRLLSGIPYAHVGALELKLDLHLPVTSTAPLPVIVWFHAGAWMEGVRGFCPVANLAKEGFAVASVSYRLSGQAVFPAQIEDCKAAVRWLRAHAATYNLDPDHIGVVGESAGGHLAALLGVSGGVSELEGTVGGNGDFSSRVQAVVGLCAPSDFTAMLERRRERSFWVSLFTTGSFNRARYTYGRAYPLRKLFGGPLTQHAEAVRLASPVTHISPDDPPFLLFHGRGDPLIPLSQSEQFQKDLLAAGVEAQLEIVETNVHSFGRFSPDMMVKTCLFFTKHLRPPVVGGAQP